MIKKYNNDFENKIKEKVLVDFYATWCAPCKMLSLVIEKSENEINIPILKVDIDENRNLAEEYNIMSVPTLIIFENGKEIKRISGYMPKDDLVRWIEE